MSTLNEPSSGGAAWPEPARLRRFSAWMAWASGALALCLPVLVLLSWALMSPTNLAIRANLPPGAVFGELALWQRALGAALTEVAALCMALGLWRARDCFKGFALGQLFTEQAVFGLRRFSVWMLRSALAALLGAPVLSVLLTFGNPPGTRMLAVGVGTDQLLLLFFAAVVWLMAAVIGQGRALAEENAAFL